MEKYNRKQCRKYRLSQILSSTNNRKKLRNFLEKESFLLNRQVWMKGSWVDCTGDLQGSTNGERRVKRVYASFNEEQVASGVAL